MRVTIQTDNAVKTLTDIDRIERKQKCIYFKDIRGNTKDYFRASKIMNITCKTTEYVE